MDNATVAHLLSGGIQVLGLTVYFICVNRIIAAIDKNATKAARRGRT